MCAYSVNDPNKIEHAAEVAEEVAEYLSMPPAKLAKQLKRLERKMYEHAHNLEFEEAARIRDQIKLIEDDMRRAPL
jgi:excinuclease ABC subunit B